MKKASILVAILMVVAILATGCAAPAPAAMTAETTETTTAALPGAGETYVVIGSLFQLEFFDALKAGVSDAANTIGAKWY